MKKQQENSQNVKTILHHFESYFEWANKKFSFICTLMSDLVLIYFVYLICHFNLQE